MSERKLFPVEQQREVGAELAVLRDEITLIQVIIARAHPKSSTIYRLASEMTAAIDQLRSELDNQLASTSPEDFDANVWYPDEEQRTRAARRLARRLAR